MSEDAALYTSPWITIPLHKGCVLVLTPAEYLRGLRRGKAHKRRAVYEKRTVLKEERDGAQ